MSQDERARHRASPQPWPTRLAVFCAIAVPVVAAAVAQVVLAPYAVSSASRLAHGSSTWMFTAGWATFAFLPGAALIFLLASNRREREVGNDPLNRAGIAHGHGVAGRGSGYWIRRLPLLLPILVAVVFNPGRYPHSFPVDWLGTDGGDSFQQGWHLSFVIAAFALVALLVFRLLALFPGRSDRLLRVAGPWTAATPALALLGLYPLTH